MRIGISNMARFELFGGNFAVGLKGATADGTESAGLLAYVGARGGDPAVVFTPGNGQLVNTAQTYRFGEQALTLTIRSGGLGFFGGVYDIVADRTPC